MSSGRFGERSPSTPNHLVWISCQTTKNGASRSLSSQGVAIAWSFVKPTPRAASTRNTSGGEKSCRLFHGQHDWFQRAVTASLTSIHSRIQRWRGGGSKSVSPSL